MKKAISFALLAAWLLSGGVAFATVGASEDGTFESQDANINYSTNLDHSSDGFTGTVSVADSPVFSGNVTFKTSIVSSGGVAASTLLKSSSTVLGPSSLPYELVWKNVGSGTTGKDTVDGGTRLANGTPGKMITFVITSLGGSSYWLLTPVTAQPITSYKFDTLGDSLTLLYVNDTIGWIPIANSGTVVNTLTHFGTGAEPSSDPT